MAEQILNILYPDRERVIRLNDTYESIMNRAGVIAKRRKQTHDPDPDPGPASRLIHFEGLEGNVVATHDGLAFDPSVRVTPVPSGQPGVEALKTFSGRATIATCSADSVFHIQVDGPPLPVPFNFLSFQIACGNYNAVGARLTALDAFDSIIVTHDFVVNVTPQLITVNGFNDIIRLRLEKTSDGVLAPGAVQTIIDVGGRPRPIGYDRQFALSDLVVIDDIVV